MTGKRILLCVCTLSLSTGCSHKHALTSGPAEALKVTIRLQAPKGDCDVDYEQVNVRTYITPQDTVTWCVSGAQTKYLIQFDTINPFDSSGHNAPIDVTKNQIDPQTDCSDPQTPVSPPGKYKYGINYNDAHGQNATCSDPHVILK